MLLNDNSGLYKCGQQWSAFTHAFFPKKRKSQELGNKENVRYSVFSSFFMKFASSAAGRLGEIERVSL